jgi:hypothetical protein
MKPKMTEGKQATKNFEQTMKKLFKVSKGELKEAEKKCKTEHRRKG